MRFFVFDSQNVVSFCVDDVSRRVGLISSFHCNTCHIRFEQLSFPFGILMIQYFTVRNT